MSWEKFRCPFEVKWEKDNSIVNLSIGSIDELHVFSHAIKKILSDTSVSAIKILMPEELNHLDWVEWLRLQLIPYATEFSLATIEHWLYPFLPHQMQSWWEKQHEKWNNPSQAFKRLIDTEPEKVRIVDSIMAALEKALWNDKFSRVDLQTFISSIYTLSLCRGAKTPGITFSWMLLNTNTNKEESIKLLEVVYLWSTVFNIYHAIESHRSDNTWKDKDTFSFITAPYYQKNVGRYSKKVTLVITRSKDFESIPQKQLSWIREKSNLAIKDAWYDVSNVQEYAVSSGIWDPEK